MVSSYGLPLAPMKVTSTREAIERTVLGSERLREVADRGVSESAMSLRRRRALERLRLHLDD